MVDDEPEVAETLAGLLDCLGFAPVVALGAHDGWARLSAPDAAYAVVTLDLKMPGLSGADLWQRLCAAGSPLAERVVFVSGDIADADSGRVMAGSDRPVLYKPVDVAQLRRVLDTLPVTARGVDRP